MNMSCNPRRRRRIIPLTKHPKAGPFDKKHLEPCELYECGCQHLPEASCPDIQEGEFEFEGPAQVYGLCNLHKSYVIVRLDDDDPTCEKNVHAVWPEGSVCINTEGNYKVKYKWDACIEEEPKFGKAPCPSCDCDNG